MNRPPILTAEERARALEKAKASRSARAEVKARVRDGELTISQVLDLATVDEAISKMRIAELLESLSGVGKVRAMAILDRLGIS
ncbi:MAG: integration host factor, actinobacterial type, partial [Candidatus Planktophila sp.]